MAPVGQTSIQALQVPAMVRGWFVHGERNIGKEFAKKKPGTRVRVQQVGMLADPAQAGLLRQGFLEDRGAVHEYPVAGAPDPIPDELGQALQAGAQHLVVVPAQGVTGDVGVRGSVEHFLCIGAPAGPVVHPCRDDAHGSGNQFRRPRAFAAVPAEVVHLAVKTAGEP